MEKVEVYFIEEKEPVKHRFRRYYDLIMGLALRDVKMRYQLSILGLYWAVLNPLLMALIWGFVFSQIFRVQGIEGVPYVVFLFCGITFWNLFANSLLSAVNCLTGNASLLAKLYFPRVILPAASVVARVVDFSFSLLVLIILMLINKVSPGPKWWLVPLFVVIQLIFTLGMAYIVAALNVLYRDVNQILGILLMLWMYMSPVLYTIEQVPLNFRKYFLFNPIGQLINMETSAVLGSGQVDSYALSITAAIAMGIYVVGLLVFRYLEPTFAEVM
ncbi:teichoic acid translocation permease protein TagG [Moorella thermoacetica]|uniref:Transport permease protein n=1 Tax=Neomoorella thermoacetica TaxID=1525 RepID=A0A1J5JEI3_NEOTH|nr:ABC transporter permease [Moorella thermoacetica]OIQ07946.1 teichoic acid translocation permease protein TagG [Moorella thermoacetica]